MSFVHVIRHGRPAAVWGGEDEDPGLDRVGQAQARAAADEIMTLPAPLRPQAVVSSPLRRCQETAGPLAQRLGLPVIVDPRVGEIPTPAGLAPSARPAWLKQAFAGLWSEIDGDRDYVGWTREVADALAGHAGAAVFSHFVALNAAMSVATGEARVLAFRPDHVSRTLFGIKDGRLILREKGAEAQSQVL